MTRSACIMSLVCTNGSRESVSGDTVELESKGVVNTVVPRITTRPPAVHVLGSSVKNASRNKHAFHICTWLTMLLSII